MANIWKKLNLRDQARINVVSAPRRFEPSYAELEEQTVVRSVGSVGSKSIEFILAFVTKRTEIAKLATQIGSRLEGDAVIWFAYPKKSSRNYQCDFSRDSGWEPLGEIGLEGVRQVAIDDDWSALRFRRVEYIKKMTRDPKRSLTKK